MNIKTKPAVFTADRVVVDMLTLALQAVLVGTVVALLSGLIVAVIAGLLS